MQNSEKIEESMSNCLYNIETTHALSRILKNLIYDEIGDVRERDIVILAEVIEENLKREKIILMILKQLFLVCRLIIFKCRFS